MNSLQQCRHGQILYNELDVYVGKSIKMYKEYSEHEAKLFQRLLRPGDNAFDVGASIGYFTVCMAKAVGHMGWVVAFEPERMTYYTLCANVAINNLQNVLCKQAVVSDASGMQLCPDLNHNVSQNFGSLSFTQKVQGMAFPVQETTLDSYEIHFPSLRLIKADVEGYEGKVLRGAERLIGQHRPFLYIEHNQIKETGPALDYLESLEYSCLSHAPSFFNPKNFAKHKKNVFGDYLSSNLFCWPKEAELPFDPVKEFAMFDPKLLKDKIRG